jgi:hypothetical protein
MPQADVGHMVVEDRRVQYSRWTDRVWPTPKFWQGRYFETARQRRLSTRRRCGGYLVALVPTVRGFFRLTRSSGRRDGRFEPAPTQGVLTPSASTSTAGRNISLRGRRLVG